MMNNFTYETRDVPIHGKRIRVLERDERGNLCGDYIGYYNANTQTVRLVPQFNPFIVREYHAKLISDLILRRIR